MAPPVRSGSSVEQMASLHFSIGKVRGPEGFVKEISLRRRKFAAHGQKLPRSLKEQKSVLNICISLRGFKRLKEVEGDNFYREGSVGTWLETAVLQKRTVQPWGRAKCLGT